MVVNMRGCAEGVYLFGLLVCGLGLLQFNTAARGADFYFVGACLAGASQFMSVQSFQHCAATVMLVRYRASQPGKSETKNYRAFVCVCSKNQHMLAI